MSEPSKRLSAARVAIARVCLDTLPPEQLGDIRLRPEQRRIVARAQRALDDHGGCLIGEDVGRGKTFIALALARQWSTPLIVAPASLRSTWMSSQRRAAAECTVISHESLSRGRAPSAPFDALIVDEAHHFRNPATIRYAELARMAASVPIVLLSATPLQNRDRDLAAQIALFHGEAAFALPRQALARFIIRGDNSAQPDVPRVAPPEWLAVDADDGAVLAAILDLPHPARPLDGGDAGALGTIGLVRAWASSRAALRATLRSRRRVATAIAQGLEVGRTPTRSEARAWQTVDGVVQLGFAPVLISRSAESASLSIVRGQLEDDDAATDRLRVALSSTSDPDVARVAVVRALRAENAQARIVAFSEYATTVAGYFDALRGDAGVGMLTARGARIATGRLARDDLLARFAPRAQHAAPALPHQAVTLLLTTDLLSEGVNLQDASIVVHLDLPWNPARLAQRVGRLRRPGGADEVRSFLIAPPAGAGALLDAEARLRRKLADARRIVGLSFDVLPTLTLRSNDVDAASQPTTTNATAAGAVIAALERWVATNVHPELCATCAMVNGAAGSGPDWPIVGAVVHAKRGWLAALEDGRLIACVEGAITESVGGIVPFMQSADQPRCAEPGETSAAVVELQCWLRQSELLDTCGVGELAGPLRHAMQERLALIVRRGRRHEQSIVLGLISRLWERLTRPMPFGAEQHALTDLSRAATDVQNATRLLTSVVDELDALATVRGAMRGPATAPRVVAMIVFAPLTTGD